MLAPQDCVLADLPGDGFNDQDDALLQEISEANEQDAAAASGGAGGSSRRRAAGAASSAISGSSAAADDDDQDGRPKKKKRAGTKHQVNARATDTCSVSRVILSPLIDWPELLRLTSPPPLLTQQNNQRRVKQIISEFVKGCLAHSAR